MGTEPMTHTAGEPTRSFTYDLSRILYEQFARAHGAHDGEDEIDGAVDDEAPALPAERVWPLYDTPRRPPSRRRRSTPVSRCARRF